MWWSPAPGYTTPARAAGWLAALLVVGTVWFGLHPPAPAGTGPTLAFNPFVYALDLLLPIIDLGQQATFAPRSAAGQLLADGLILAGWTLATTIAAGAGRALRRDEL